MQAERKARILCIDDEPIILALLNRILTIEGYSVFTAINAEEALLSVENNDPDLIISDYLMPEITGTELIRLINDKSPQSKKIILTGQADDREIEKAMQQGLILKCLSKPITAAMIKKELSELGRFFN